MTPGATKIAQVSVHMLTIPHPPEHRWEKGSVSSTGWDQVIVEVQTEGGITGIGEAYHLKNPRPVVAVLESTMAPMLIGRDLFDTERNWQLLYNRSQQLGSTAVAALSGIDTALHDAQARHLGIPLKDLLGGSSVEGVKLYVGGHALGWRGLDDLQDLIDEARIYVNAGFKALKIRGGRGVPSRGDIETVRAVREEFGDDIDIMVDANHEYLDLHTAIETARQLAPYNIFWLEDPFTFSTAQHVAEMAKLSAAAGVRIASGGNTFLRFAAKNVAENRAADVIMSNTAKAGGVSEIRKIHAIASAYNAKFSPHCDGGLNAYSNLHSYCAAPPYISDGMYMEWDPVWPFAEVFTNPPVVKDGYACLPSSPGLGTELRKDVDERLPFKDGTWFKLSAEAVTAYRA